MRYCGVNLLYYVEYPNKIACSCHTLRRSSMSRRLLHTPSCYYCFPGQLRCLMLSMVSCSTSRRISRGLQISWYVFRPVYLGGKCTAIHKNGTHFTARRYAERGIATASCPSVLSVRLSVCDAEVL